MQVGNISLVSQRFAPTRCNCSSSSQVKKTRNRIPKEERRAMVETFITKFRETNEGTFPSLKKTHKEVGGSFYTVREIVRDIIQENRVLGPGDLDMQTLTLENIPISPEICENGTGLEQDFEGNGNGGFQYIDDESSIEIETETIEEFESEIKGEKAEISMENGKICTGDLLEESLMEAKVEKIDKVHEIKQLMKIVQNNGKIPTGDLQEISEIKTEGIKSEKKEVESEISQNNGKILTGDLQENSVMEIKTEGIEKSEIEEVKSEIYVNGKITTGDHHESEMKMKVEPTENCESEIKELEKEQLSTRDLHFESKMEVVIKTETVDKSEFDIKEESEILQNNEMEKFEKLGLEVGLGLADFKSNDGFERAKRTVVQVEQFPLPSKSHNKKDSGSVLAEGKKKEEELVEVQQTAGSVNSMTETLNNFENSVSSNSSVQEKSVTIMPKTENEAVSKNATKTKKVPIDEYLMRRHESHLKLDYMTSGMISLDASINRETSENKREKAQANPFWVTFHAFITSVVKFWSQ